MRALGRIILTSICIAEYATARPAATSRRGSTGRVGSKGTHMRWQASLCTAACASHGGFAIAALPQPQEAHDDRGSRSLEKRGAECSSFCFNLPPTVRLGSTDTAAQSRDIASKKSVLGPPVHRSCRQAWRELWAELVVLWREFWSGLWDGGEMPAPPDRAKGYGRSYPLPGTPMSVVDPKMSGLWRPDGPE